MTSPYTVTLVETQDKPVAELERGLTAACAAYNASQEGDEGFTALDEAGYVDFVMNNACASYANQYPAT